MIAVTSPALVGALAAGLAATVAGLVAYGALRAPEPTGLSTEGETAAPVTPRPDAEAPPETGPAVEAEPPASDTAAAATPAAPPEPAISQGTPAAPFENAAAKAGPAARPGFDLVRVAPNGSAVVAGSAAPGSRVTILGAEGPVAEVEADDAGDFVAVFRTAPGTEPQALTLEAESVDGDRTPSDDVVVLLPEPPAAADAAAGSAPERAQRTGAAPGGAATPAPAAETSSAPTEAGAAETRTARQATAEAEAAETGASTGVAAPQDLAAAPTEAAPDVAATAVLRGGPAAGTVEATPAETGAGLTLAGISYAEAGAVTLAGLGAAGARLRAYVDDRFARDGAVGADGRWTLELGDLAAGVYRLRIDALRPDGTVEARIETPFQRDFPAAAGPEGAARPASITVQPGNNLWTLARIHYGSGVLYTQIHTANRELIRDPALIYPGQIFVLPESATAE